ncbi:hypothetical protein C7830_23390 [Pandoraea apista]|nr:hypothetical protein C7830_23390 [Pandoraea apista]
MGAIMNDEKRCGQSAPNVWYIVESSEPEFDDDTGNGVFGAYSREGLRRYAEASAPIIAIAKDLDELVKVTLEIGAAGSHWRDTGLTVRDVLSGEA